MIETFSVKLRRGTFYRLMILSPTFTPKELYGAPDERRLGLAVAELRLEGRPYENIGETKMAFAIPGLPPADAKPSAYTFPILS
jgi:hypothetical protein